MTSTKDSVASIGGARTSVIDGGRHSRSTPTNPVTGLLAVACVIVSAGKTLRPRGVDHAFGSAAGIQRALVVIVQLRWHPNTTGALTITGLTTIAQSRVIAGSTSGRRLVRDTRCGFAAIHRARVIIVDWGRLPCPAGTLPVAAFRTVAGVTVRTRATVRERGMSHSAHRFASVVGARVTVIHTGGVTRLASTEGVASLDAIAHIGIRAVCSRGPRYVRNATGGAAAVNGAGIAVIWRRELADSANAARVALACRVARRGGRASGAFRYGFVASAQECITGVLGARVCVIVDQRDSRSTAARAVARLLTIAGVVVRAGKAPWGGRVRYAQGGITRIHGALVLVVDGRRRACGTRAVTVAGFAPVAARSVIAA